MVFEVSCLAQVTQLIFIDLWEHCFSYLLIIYQMQLFVLSQFEISPRHLIYFPDSGFLFKFSTKTMMTESPEFQEMSFACSKLGCLLLHCNNTNDIHHFNPLFMMPTNMRVQLNLSKLVPVDTDDALDQNALWKMVNCYDPMHSPVSGNFSGVSASFQEGGSSATTNLLPVYGSMDGLNLVAIPADRATIGNALKWLCGDDVSIEESSCVQELCTKFFHLLNEMDIPNGSVDILADFIWCRTWDESHLYGEEQCPSFGKWSRQPRMKRRSGEFFVPSLI